MTLYFLKWHCNQCFFPCLDMEIPLLGSQILMRFNFLKNKNTNFEIFLKFLMRFKRIYTPIGHKVLKNLKSGTNESKTSKIQFPRVPDVFSVPDIMCGM